MVFHIFRGVILAICLPIRKFDCIFHSAAESSLSRSAHISSRFVYPFAFGSRAIRSPSLRAAIVVRLDFGMPTVNGIAQSFSTFFVNIVNNPETEIPTSSQNSESSFLSVSSSEIVKFAISYAPFMKEITSYYYNNTLILCVKQVIFTCFSQILHSFKELILWR